MILLPIKFINLRYLDGTHIYNTPKNSNTGMKLFLKLLMFSAMLSSCSNNENRSKEEVVKEYLSGQIISSYGYQKTLSSDTFELLGYYENLFLLFMLDEKKFAELVKFLHEDGSRFSLVERKLKLGKIIESGNYEIRSDQFSGSDCMIIKLLVNKKIAYQLLIKPSNAKYISNSEQYHFAVKTFSDTMINTERGE